MNHLDPVCGMSVSEGSTKVAPIAVSFVVVGGGFFRIR